MEIKAMAWGSMLEEVEKGEFDACTLGWGASSPPYPSDFYQIWHSSQIGERGSNHIFYRNPKVDRLIEERRRELDPKKGQQMEWEVERALYDDQPYLWLFMPAELQAYNKKWRGVKFYVPRPGRWLNEWHLFDPADE
jgi:peptide/nickel transport system substrate-binding protein